MKKLVTLLATTLLGGALLLSGCGSSSNTNNSSQNDKVITIGASPVPHAQLLEQVKPILAKDGIELKVIEFTDYVNPNLALNDKELDANFFQHTPYLDKFNSERNMKLVSAAKIHLEPMGIYSHSVKDIKAVPDNAKIGIPNDPTNGGRALLLLQKAGLITLKDPTNITSSISDITNNPHNYKIVELEAAQLPRSLDDVSIAVINTNFAIEAKLNPLKDALFMEGKDSPYANIIAVRAGDENSEKIKKLIAALQSAEIKKYIETTYQGAIIPSF